MIPKDNVKDLREIPDNVKSGLEIIPVRWINEVLEKALQHMPTKVLPTPDTATVLPPEQASFMKSIHKTGTNLIKASSGDL